MGRSTSNVRPVAGRFFESLEDRRLLSGTPTPLGGESAVNIYSQGYQSIGTSRSVDSAANGNYAVAWESSGSGVAADQIGIFAALYTKLSDGSYAKREVRVDSVGTNPSIGMDDSGKFVVAWVVNSGSNKQANDVYARRYNADGTPAEARRMVNSYTSSGQFWPTVAVAGTGGYVIAWTSDGQDGSGHGVYAKRFSAGGTEQAPPTGVPRGTGNEYRVNTYTSGNQNTPSAAIDDAGNFAVAWTSGPAGRSLPGRDGDGNGVFAQRFTAAGQLQGREFQVNQTTKNAQAWPQTGMSGGGNLLVAWECRTDTSNDVYARRYTSAGTAVSGEFLVDSGPILSGQGGANTGGVAFAPSGSALVTWTKFPPGNGGDGEIYGQSYDASGAPNGDHFMVNQTTQGDQSGSAAAFLSDSQFVVAWNSGDFYLAYDVRVRTFTIPPDTTAVAATLFSSTSIGGATSSGQRDESSLAAELLA